MLRSRFNPHWQTVINLHQEPPVQNTWYTSFTATKPGILVKVSSRQENTGANPMNLECQWTIDGTLIGATAWAATSGSYYNNHLNQNGVNTVIAIDNYRNVGQYIGFPFRTAVLQIRTTGVVGAGQMIDQWVYYYYYVPAILK